MHQETLFEPSQAVHGQHGSSFSSIRAFWIGTEIRAPLYHRCHIHISNPETFYPRKAYENTSRYRTTCHQATITGWAVTTIKNYAFCESHHVRWNVWIIWNHWSSRALCSRKLWSEREVAEYATKINWECRNSCCLFKTWTLHGSITFKTIWRTTMVNRKRSTV